MSRPAFEPRVAVLWPDEPVCDRCGRLTGPSRTGLKPMPAVGAYCRCRLFDNLEANACRACGALPMEISVAGDLT